MKSFLCDVISLHLWWERWQIQSCSWSDNVFELLPLIDVSPLRKLMDRSRTLGENVCTLRWWSVAADGYPSFKDILGQVENRRRNCFYFAMMMCCCRWISILQGNWWTGEEPKEKLFLLSDDDLLLLIDVRPSNKLMDRSRSEGDTVSTLRWWSVAANTPESFE